MKRDDTKGIATARTPRERERERERGRENYHLMREVRTRLKLELD
jgi:hypothetical protein